MCSQSAVLHPPQDQPWDDFLRASPTGQFQQSSLWARVKEADGWKVARNTHHDTDGIVSGHQVLWKSKSGLRLGLVNKGPVAASRFAESNLDLIRRLKEHLRSLRLHAAVVQPPDASLDLAQVLARGEFLPDLPLGAVSATLLVDLACTPQVLEQRMTRSARQNVRQAAKRGVTVIEGAEVDLPLFFELMRSSCVRQGAQPNPSSVRGLQSLWSAFGCSQAIRLTFAVVGGERISGLLALAFGNRLTLWKKGWSEKSQDLHPNELLNFEAISWAQRRGFKWCDFGACDRDMAETLVAGRPLSEAHKRTRHFFNLRFGAQPALLPTAQLYLPNPVLRLICRLTGNSALFRRVAAAVT